MSVPITDPQPEPEYAAYLAIDWADRKHYWRLRVPGIARDLDGTLEHTPEALEDWFHHLFERFPDQPLALAVEMKRGPLINALSKYGQLVIYPVHGAALANFRLALHPSGKKDDPEDTKLLLELLCKHRQQLRPLLPETENTRKLQILVQERRTMVDDRTQSSNRLTAKLKGCFPQALKWFGSADSPLMLELLQRWPTLQELQRARPSSLEKLLQQHHYGAEQIQAVRKSLPAAIALTNDPAIVETSLVRIRQMAAELVLLGDHIRQVEATIDTLTRSHPDYPIFASLPGAGSALEPRLIVAFGTNREHFATASDVQCRVGIAPIERSSGKACQICFRWACPKFLRQSFHEWAAQTIRYCPWARAYYDRQIAAGHHHHAAVRSLAFKWIRIVYRCWKDHVPYNESRYTASLLQRNPTLWKSCGGFHEAT